MLGAAGRIVMMTPTATSSRDPSNDGRGSEDPQDQQQLKDRALGLLLDICSAASAASGPSDWGVLRARALPLLLTAQPGGVALAAAVRAIAVPPAAGLLLRRPSPFSTHQSSGGASSRKQKGKASAGKEEEVGEVVTEEAGAGSADGGMGEARRLWCALQLLPHACEAPSQAVAACRQVVGLNFNPRRNIL